MKKLLILCFFIFCIGCDYYIPCGTMENYYFENDLEFYSVASISDYIRNNILYAYDKDVHNKEDYWQTPEETYNLQTGDCEDIALFFAYFVYNQLGMDCKIALLKLIGRDKYHATPYFEGECFKASVNRWYTEEEMKLWKIRDILTYGKAMGCTYNRHNYD